MDVTVIADSTDDGLTPVTAQLVGAAASIGGNPTVLCPGGVGASEAASISGVSKVISVEGDCFGTYEGGAWATALDSQATGDLVLAAASPRGRDIAASLAALRKIPVIQDATGLEVGLVVSRPIYSGKAMETSNVEGPCVITLRANAFDAAPDGGTSEVSTVNQSADVGLAH